MRRITFLFVMFLAVLSAQQIGENKRAGADTAVTFTSNSQLVVETVTVKDKSGKTIDNLTANDFTVTEDGMPQTIKLFEFQKFDEAQEAPLPLAPAPVAIPKLPQSKISAETPGTTKYRDRRLLVLYFDMSAMPLADQARALDAAIRFIRTQMTPSDLVALMAYTGGAVHVLQDFTGDRDRLTSIVETLIVGEDEGLDSTTNDASTSDTGAAFGQDDTEFNIFNTDRQLAALQTAATMLGQVSEKKALLYFASGLNLNGLNNQAQLHATTNAAVRAGVTLWPVDARGLVANAPLGDATKGSPGGIGMFNGSSAVAFASNFQASQDTMYALASDTGGKALLDSNDLSMGIVNAEKSVTSYYIIGYYTTNANPDGKFRRIKISVGGGLTASLDFRQGYFAPKTFNKFTATDKERQLEDALMLGDPVTELTIAMELDYFQLNRAEYFVPLVVRIPGSELALARRGGAEHTLIDFIGEVKDDFGTTITNVRDKVDIKLTGTTAAELAKRPIEYDTGFTLLPGKYTVKFLARDAETGRIGTFQMNFLVPNLNKEDKRIPISSVVLSSQRIDLKDALYNANKDKGKADAVNPLNQEGSRLIPSVTRVFSKTKDMYVYLQAYEPGIDTTQPLLAFVTFYKGQTKAFETSPVTVSEATAAKLKTLPVRFDVPLGTLAAGEYNCQVTLLDANSHKAAFWQAPIMLIP